MNAEMTLQLEKRRWWILAVIGLINLCAGSIYAWSVLAAASAAKLSSVLGTAVTPGDLAIAFGVANTVGPIPMILGGAINDRFGPRTVIVAGGFLMGLGLICCGLAESVGTLIAAYGGLFGLGLTYGACITTAVRYFPDRRGMAGGIVTAAYGMSSVLVPPIAQALIGSVGITATFIILGTVCGAAIMAGGFVCRQCPPDFVPHGMVKKAKAEAKGLTWREMLRSPVFYPMIALLLSGAFAGMMIISQAASIARHEIGMTAAAAAVSVSVIALFNMAGRLVAGILSDHLGRITVLAGALCLSLAGLFTLMTAGWGISRSTTSAVSSWGSPLAPLWRFTRALRRNVLAPRNSSVNYGISSAASPLLDLAVPR